MRKAQKLYDAGDTSGASQILTEFQTLLDNSDQKVKPKYLFLKGKIAQNNKEYQAAYDILTSIEDASYCTSFSTESKSFMFLLFYTIMTGQRR